MLIAIAEYMKYIADIFKFMYLEEHLFSLTVSSCSVNGQWKSHYTVIGSAHFSVSEVDPYHFYFTQEYHMGKKRHH